MPCPTQDLRLEAAGRIMGPGPIQTKGVLSRVQREGDGRAGWVIPNWNLPLNLATGGRQIRTLSLRSRRKPDGHATRGVRYLAVDDAPLEPRPRAGARSQRTADSTNQKRMSAMPR